ncbi:MAG: RloB family protein [Lachnospiraceae bacterium]|nr:RloB family protein [Lachnospiraceae bacterium]
MSMKPPKKSDNGKSWMKSRNGRSKKIQPEYHLIVTEGTDTEPAYFGAMKEEINRHYHDRIDLTIIGEGDNTLNLFQKARQRAASNPNGYRHVWIVYDTDDFPAEHVDQVPQLAKDCSNEETEYHAIWSNQCIELWFLLHFSYMQSNLHRSEYWPKLSGCLEQLGCGKYEKNRKDMYHILLPFMEQALANAKRLNQENRGKRPSESAPGTNVYELVEWLKPWLI